MTEIVELPSFRLKDEVSELDFLKVHEKFNRDFMSKQKGYIMHKLLKDGDIWYDLAIWNSIEDMQIAFTDIYSNESAIEYISLIDQIGSDEDIPLFKIIKNY